MEVNKRQQLEYLERKYIDLEKEYLHELNEGQSLINLKDLSVVLNTIAREIEMLRKDVGENAMVNDNVGE